MSNPIIKLWGKSYTIFKEFDGDFQKTYSNICFFQPFTSASDRVYRTASIVAAPVLFMANALNQFFLAVGCLISSTLNMATGNYEYQYKGRCERLEAFVRIVSCLMCLVLAVLSPIINFIDLIGSSLSPQEQTVTSEDVCTK